MGITRLVTLDDAPVLADLLQANREFLAPWDPIRDEGYYTVDGQYADIGAALEEHARGVRLPHLVLAEDGRVVGRITLTSIVRGPFQSCNLGYWVSGSENGRGLATAAVREVVQLAFEQLGLHRVEAGAVPHNVRSRRVLERTGFVAFGLAPAYLRIAGEWQDHVMYQQLNPAGG